MTWIYGKLWFVRSLNKFQVIKIIYLNVTTKAIKYVQNLEYSEACYIRFGICEFLWISSISNPAISYFWKQEQDNKMYIEGSSPVHTLQMFHKTVLETICSNYFHYHLRLLLKELRIICWINKWSLYFGKSDEIIY